MTGLVIAGLVLALLIAGALGAYHAHRIHQRYLRRANDWLTFDSRSRVQAARDRGSQP
jgi:hypothetical protein